MWKVMALASLAILAAGSTGVHAADKSAEPQGNTYGWFTADDYPVEALATRAEGSVTMAFDISAEGKVTFCSVVISSKSAALDETSCRLMKERGHFTPVLDRKGKPIASKGTRRVTWKMPVDDSRRPTDTFPQRVVMQIDVDEGGQVTGCKLVETVYGTVSIPESSQNMIENQCKNIVARNNNPIIVDATGKPVRARLQFTNEIKLVPLPAPK